MIGLIGVGIKSLFKHKAHKEIRKGPQSPEQTIQNHLFELFAPPLFFVNLCD